MAEGPDPGQTLVKSAAATPLLKELSNALDSVVNWHSLGVKLGLEDHELSTIEQNYRGDGNERCKHEMLSRWLRSDKLSTWKAVVDALQRMGEQAVASRIRAKYCCSSTATTDTADIESPPGTGPQSPSTVAIAHRNIQMIQQKFSILVTNSRKKIRSRKIEVDDVQMFLITLYSSPNSKDGSDTVTAVVESARSLDEIFRALSKHRLWDYLNYYLLQSIIEEFAGDDKELNGMMEEYQEALTGHILTLRIQTYLDATKYPIATSDSDNLADEVASLQQNHELFKKLTAKCEVNITNHTLTYVTDLWRSLAKQFALPQPAMILHDIAEGCIGITWFIPANLVEYVTRMARETANMFAEENVLKVTLEEFCIYHKGTQPRLVATETAALKAKIKGGNRSLDLPGGRRSDLPGGRESYLPASADQDERENPEDIPEYELKLRGFEVMTTNYSFLWQYLEPRQLLPILVDKLLLTETDKEKAESYKQKFAQNAVIINKVFFSDCPPLKLCDTLDVTGQEHIARKLLQDYKDPTSRSAPLPGADTAVHSDLSETSEVFQQLQRGVMNLLDQFPNALAKLKQVLASLVLPLGEGKVAPLVDPLAYENTQTVRELFRLMAPYWNPLSTDLLGLLLEASGCNQAASKVAEFVEARASKSHLVLCIRQLPTLASGENDLDMADLETVHNAPLSELQSLHPAVFARLPEYKLTSTRTTVRISVEVNKPLVYIADYEEIITAVSGLFTVPKAALVYAGCSKAPLVLCWLASHELVAYIRSAPNSLSGHRLLAESKVTAIAVGDKTYKCPSVKEVELLEACWYGMVGLVHHLLTTGVNVNVTEFDSSFPLVDASQKGYDGIVEMLLQAGATVDLQSKDGVTALEGASIKGHHKVVEVLLGARANPDLQDEDGDTALRESSINGHHKVVELLLGAGANPDVQNKEGYSPLHSASKEGHDGIVEMLLQAGATVDLQTKAGFTALERSSFFGHQKVVKLLLGAGANPDLQDKNGFSPLTGTSQKGHDGIVEMLLQAGATVNLQSKSGDTPLILASYKGHPSVVRVLLQAGANINTTTQSGETALHVAVREEREDIVELLLEANADPDLPKKDSRETALMTAARKGNVGIIRKLVKHGASINLTNKVGNTAYDLASVEGHTDVCQELLAHHSS